MIPAPPDHATRRCRMIDPGSAGFLIHWHACMRWEIYTSLCGMYIDIILIAMGKEKNKTKHRILPKDITDYLKIMATISNMTLIIFL